MTTELIVSIPLWMIAFSLRDLYKEIKKQNESREL
jgi:hypothetical protein